jgi:hypothetical protein
MRLAALQRLACLSAFFLASHALGAMITFQTPIGALAGGQSVDATAQFTTSDNQIFVVLTNLQADPKSVAQNLSDLLFTVSTGQTTGTLTSSSGRERIVNGNGTFSDSQCTTSTGWSLTTNDKKLYLNVLGTSIAPAHTIIGPANSITGLYGNANDSIAGNGPHNLFLGMSASFILSVSGVTSASTINAATFSFGTTSGSNVAGTIVPEPASLSLLTLTAMGMLARRR